MATAISPRLPKFVPALNAPQVVAIAAIPGRLVPSEFGPSEVLFSLVDGRPWYVPQVIADEIYAAGITPRQQIEVTAVGKKKTEVRIVPVQTALPRRPPERDYTRELEQSIRDARGPENNWADTLPHVAAPTTPDYSGNGNATALYPQAGPLSPTALRFMGAYKDAVDIMVQTQTYAKSQGILLNVETADVRCLAATIMIGSQR